MEDTNGKSQHPHFILAEGPNTKSENESENWTSGTSFALWLSRRLFATRLDAAFDSEPRLFNLPVWQIFTVLSNKGKNIVHIESKIMT